MAPGAAGRPLPSSGARRLLRQGVQGRPRGLDNPKWVDSKTWHSKDGDPATRSTGMASIRMLAEEIRHSLPPMETPGLPTEVVTREKAKKVLQRAGAVSGD